MIHSLYHFFHSLFKNDTVFNFRICIILFFLKFNFDTVLWTAVFRYFFFSPRLGLRPAD